MDNLQDIYISEVDFRRRYEYTSENLLGEGGFAQVYKAYDRQFNEYVALKFYNKGERGKYDVLHEMKDTRSFAHKNIIRVHDAFVVRCEHAGTYTYIQVGVLEYANGGNLRDFIKTKPPEDRFVEVLTGILEGLKYLHKEKGIIHRDLSPENILMCIDGNKWIPKISDFGISKKIDLNSISARDKKSTQLLGKTEYMAPEQFYPEKFGINGSINTTVDLWAFGIILYELFMHKTPYGEKIDEYPLRAIHSIISDPVPDVDEIPDPYRKVIQKCLVKEASKRIQNPDEIIHLLSDKEKESAKQGKTRPVVELEKKKTNLKLITISLFAVLVLAAGFFALRSVLKSPGDNKYSEIEKLVTNSQYHEALAIIENLPARLRLDTVISGFYRKCRVKVSVDSISALIGTGQFLPAMRFHENLPEEISSDSILQVLYHQSEMLLVTDSLSRMVANSDFSEGRKYYEGLSSQLKNDPKIDSVYRKLLYLIKIDSLKTEGNEFFENKEYKRSADIFNLILKKYDRSNQYADSMIKVINALNQVKEPEPEIIIPSEGCLKFYSGRTLKYESAPDTRIVRMFSICLKQSEMIITIQIQPLDYDITIFNPLTDRAFYLEYYSGSGKQPLRLKDIPPPTKVDRRIRISKPTTVNLVFPRLPEGVTKFDLLEGRNQRDPNQKYWNFTGIRLI